ncbi:MAG: thiamine pyrophosphate-binding protein [Ruminococcus sp.]|nr:thiamine pyrophosphate-binding protein [Ruminococcus sp.]
MIAAECLVRALCDEGVTDIFGYPGAAIDPFLECLSTSDIAFTLMRSEGAAGLAANGYARTSHTIGVTAVTSGAGALNLLPAIACAYADSIPIVAITGQVRSFDVGTDAFQEADITGSAEPFVKYSYLIKEASDIPRIVKEAFYLASAGRQGPVLIDIPVDILQTECEYKPTSEIKLRSYNPTSEGNVFQIKKAAEIIAAAKRPLIIAGGGIHSSGAVKALADFTDFHNIPLVTTMMGLGIKNSLGLNIGMIGIHGNAHANAAVKEADTLILLGARAGERSIPDPTVTNGKEVIHVDIDPAEIGKNIIPTIPIVSDCRNFIEKLFSILSDKLFDKPWITAEKRIPQTPLDIYFDRLSELMKPDTIIAADVGNNQIAASKITAGRFLTSGGMGTMGYALPAAIGASVADRSRDIICIAGDGGFQMSFAELATIREKNLPIKIIIVNNNALGMVKDSAAAASQTALMNGFAVDMSKGNPDFALLAGCYSLTSETVTDFNTESIQKLLSADEAYLINLVI